MSTLYLVLSVGEKGAPPEPLGHRKVLALVGVSPSKGQPSLSCVYKSPEGRTVSPLYPRVSVVGEAEPISIDGPSRPVAPLLQMGKLSASDISRACGQG